MGKGKEEGFKVDCEELAWAAGFFDGEGHVRNRGKKYSKGYELCVTQNPVGDEKTPYVLERFKSAVGRGIIFGPYHYPSRKAAGSKPAYAFRAGRFDDVSAIAAYLWPYLSPVKRLQFTKALTKPRAHSIWHRCGRLGKKNCKVCKDVGCYADSAAS